MIKAYIAILLIVGVAMAAFGILLPLGGGLIIAAIGTAAIAAGLTLIGVELRSPSR
jgi:hypothetical protein